VSELADRLRAEPRLLAEVVADDAPASGQPLAVAAIREGYDLHAAGGSATSVVRTDDADLALLAGDRLYAMGLAELAAAGDLAGVRAMAGVIASASAARAAGDAEAAEAAWRAGISEMAHASRPDASSER